MNPSQKNPTKSTANSSNFESQYKKKKILGEGSYGKAYLVEETHTKKEYAMKTIIISGLNKKEIEDAKKEAKILKNLDHPNIIHFKEVFICKFPKLTLNIITEFADGGDLSQKIEKQKELKTYFKEHLILDYFTQICLALYHIHSHNIIHRDIKAQNVFLTKNGIIKLGDFGIAKNLANTWDLAKTVIGTPYYLSPEIINNKPYNNKTDIWSLGVLLYQLVTLRLPFEANNLPILSMRILKGKFKPIPTSFSKPLADLIDHLLKVNPKERPDMKEILKYDIIRERMKVLLEEVSYNKDFSNTFIGAIREEKKEKKKSKFANCQNNNSNNNSIENKVIKKTKTNPVEIKNQFNVGKSHSNKISENHPNLNVKNNSSSGNSKNKKEVITDFLKKSKENNSGNINNSNNTTVSNNSNSINNNNSINASYGDNNKSNNLKDFINEGSMQIIFQDKNNNEILYNLNGVANKSGKEKNYPKVIITNKNQNKKSNNFIIKQKLSFNNLNNNLNNNNSNNNSLKSENSNNNNDNNDNNNDNNYFKIEYNENIHNNDNNKKKELNVKKDLYDAHRILQNYNSILNNETMDNNNLDTIYNDDDYGEIENENNEYKLQNNSIEKENENRFKMSIINKEDKQEINEIKKKLEKKFPECEKLIEIFKDNCDKEKFAIDIEKIKNKLKQNGKNNKEIDEIMRYSPEFTCLCVNKKIS